MPPNEKGGRVHTSTITVAVLPEPTESELTVSKDDVIIKTVRGSGKGGQNRNKLETAIDITHKETGITAHCESERSQYQNIQSAMMVLRAKIFSLRQNSEHNKMAADRKSQVGSGMRGDKRRTIRVKDGVVIDHVLNKKWRYEDYKEGKWES